jgi:hypothetical protein
LFFALHPLRVESVAWVTERRDVLSLLFYLGATLAYLWAFPKGSVEPVSRGRYVLVVTLFLLSLMSKAWAMTFFAVLLALDAYPLARLTWSGLLNWDRSTRRVLIQKLPFAVAGMAWVLIAGAAQSSTPGTVRTLEQWSIASRIGQAAYGLMFYIWKTVAPTGLAVLYELPKSLSLTEPRVIAGLFVSALLGAIALVARRRAPAVSVAIVCYIVIVLPVLGVFQSGIQLVADRYTYVSMVPAAIVAVAGLATATRRVTGRARTLLLIPGGLIFLALFALTWRQTGYWQDARTLFARAIELGQDGPITRASYARQLDTPGLQDEAVAQFRRALELDPRFGEAWFDLGRVLKDQKRLPEAKDAFERARGLMSDSWRADEHLGLLYAEDLNDLDAALKLFESAVQKIEGPEAPWFQPGPYMTLAQALYDFGDVEGARRALEKAVQFKETHDKANAALKQIAGGH